MKRIISFAFSFRESEGVRLERVYNFVLRLKCALELIFISFFIRFVIENHTKIWGFSTNELGNNANKLFEITN